MKQLSPFFRFFLLLLSVSACTIFQNATPALNPAETGSTSGAPPSQTLSGAVPSIKPEPSPEFLSATPNPIPCNWAEWTTDVSIPDGWQIGPSVSFTKTWRLKNIGSCPWDSGYALIFEAGERMGAPDSQPLAEGTVEPGAAIDVSVHLVSPGVPGTYQGNFRLRSADGSIFGIGPGVDGSFPVRIRVVAGGERDLVSYQVAARTTVPAGTSGDLTAECPAGTFATGGGFDGHETLIAHHQGLSANGWRVMAVNNSGSDRLLTAYVICLPDIPGVIVSQETGEHDVFPDVLGQVNIPCPEGSVVSSLGYAFDPRTIRIAGGDFLGNTARIFGMSLSGSQTLRGMAVCMAPYPRVRPQQILATTMIPGGGTKQLEAPCPAGTFIAGGSFGHDIEVTVTATFKKTDADAWTVFAKNPTAGELRLITYAICMNIAMM